MNTEATYVIEDPITKQPLLHLVPNYYMCLRDGKEWAIQDHLPSAEGKYYAGYCPIERYLYPKVYSPDQLKPKKINILNLGIVLLWLSMQEVGNAFTAFRSLNKEIVDEFFYKSICFYNSDFKQHKDFCKTDSILSECFKPTKRHFIIRYQDDADCYDEIIKISEGSTGLGLAYVARPEVDNTPEMYAQFFQTATGNWTFRVPNEDSLLTFKEATKFLKSNPYVVKAITLGVLSMLHISLGPEGFYYQEESADKYVYANFQSTKEWRNFTDTCK